MNNDEKSILNSIENCELPQKLIITTTTNTNDNNIEMMMRDINILFVSSIQSKSYDIILKAMSLGIPVISTSLFEIDEIKTTETIQYDSNEISQGK